MQDFFHSQVPLHFFGEGIKLDTWYKNLWSFWGIIPRTWSVRVLCHMLHDRWWEVSSELTLWCFYVKGINSCPQLDGYCFISAMKEVFRNQQKIKVFAWCMSKWAKDYFITEWRANEQLFGDWAPARYFNVIHESFWNLSFFLGDFCRSYYGIHHHFAPLFGEYV